MCIGTIGNPKAGGPSQPGPERVALSRPTLTDAQSLFYNARYEEAAGLALALRVSDTEDLATVELRSSALLFQLKALLQGRPARKVRSNIARRPDLIVEFLADIHRGQNWLAGRSGPPQTTKRRCSSSVSWT
jgi:hypothetical protein